MGRLRVAVTAGAVLAMAGLAAGITVNPGESIQAAIDGALDGDTINVAAGAYDEVLSINKPISLIGAGAGSTILTYTGAAREQLIFLGTNSGSTINGSVLIEGFSLLDGSGIGGDNDLIKFRAQSSGGQIVIQNNLFDANGDSGSKGIEESQGSGNFVITGNEFLGTRYAVWLNTAFNGEITDNTLANARIGMGGNAAEGDGPRDLVVARNTIDGAGEGSYGLVLANNIERVEFSCNSITDWTAAGVLYWEYGNFPEWDGVTFHNNSFVDNAEGFMGYNDPNASLPALVDATGNWWGDASGPSGVGPGTGDSILVGNLAFDPWLTAPPPCAPGGPVIPEPVTLAGLMLGIGCLARYVRRRRA